VNAARKRAARLAIYLECAGLNPAVQGATYREYCVSLEKQYRALELEVRRSARIEGRRRIREQEIQTTASRLIPVPIAVCDLAKLNPEQRRRVRVAYLKKISHSSPEILPCPKCRIASGMPKRSWSTRELAEKARSRQNDPRLHVYPCPAQPGFWHLGHVR
jgi:hypothetical protein